MALSDMFGLLGGGGSDPLDIYGDLFSREQKAALQQRSMNEGLLRMAGAFGKAAQPSRAPTSFWGSLGEAAGAMAGHGDEAANTALKGMKVAEDVRQARAERAILARAAPFVEAITKQLIGAGVPAAQAAQIAPQIAAQAGGGAGAPQASGAPAAPPGQTVSATAADAPVPQETTGYMQPVPPGAPAPPRVTGTGVMPPGGLITPDDYSRYLGTPAGPAAPPPAGQQHTGLLPKPPDQVVGPDGQPLQGPGVLPNIMNASLTGGGAGAPLPFARASSPPTPSATPGAPSRDDPRGVVPYIRERAKALGIDPDVAERVARSEGVGSFQSNVIQKGGRREPSFGAFQLYTGGGMGNDFQRDTGLDPADPANEKATIDYALQKARTGGWTPFHGAKGAGISARAGIPGGEDYVIPSGQGIPASALRRVADTGAAPGGAPATGGGFLPGTTVTPEALAALNAMLKMGGMKSDPFGSLLESYYKSPDYLRQKAITEKTAEKQVGLEYDPKIAAASAAATQKYIQENETHKSGLTLARDLIGKGVYLNKETGRMEPIENAAQAMAEIDRVKEQNKADLEVVDTTLKLPGETQSRKFQVTRKQASDIAKGLPVPELGIPAMTGIQMGQPVLSEEEKATAQQRGKTAQETREVDVWTPTGTVKQTMSNQEIWAREALAAKRGGGGAPQIGDIVNKPAMTQTDQKIADAFGEEFIALRKQATVAPTTISETHNLRAKLDSGMFTGMDANWNLFAARLGDTLGWKNLSDPDKVKNTETYIAGIGKEVLAMAQNLKPASNLDLQFLERAAGGINLSAASVRELLDMRERYARLTIERYNEEARGRNPEIFKGTRREIPLPPEYQPKELTTPSGNKATINR